MTRYDSLSGSHDLSLPEWGPYSKKLFGISHLADRALGTRFDCSVIPGKYRRELAIPDVLRPSGYLPWNVAPDLSAYSYRQQLEWKDRIYCDVSFSTVNEKTHLIRCELVNHSEIGADLAIHLLCRLEFEAPHHTEVSGILEWARPEVQDGRGLFFDALHPGEFRDPDAVTGSAFRIRAGQEAIFRFHGNSPEKVLYLRVREEGKWVLRKMENSGENAIRMTFERDAEVNGAALTVGNQPVFRSVEHDASPEFSPGPAPDSTVVKYKNVPCVYGIRRAFSSDFVRHYAVDDLLETFLYDDGVHQHFFPEFERGSRKDHALDMVFQPIPIAPGGRKIIYAVIVNGNEEEVRASLPSLDFSAEALEEIYRRNAANYITFPESPLKFSQERMAAVTLSNIVYPTYVKDSFVRHHTPGRRWNSLYTWDSGFIGLGLLELEVRRAIESLNAYLTEEGDPENAFILHGTPLPVQIYLYQELWSRTHDRDLLRFFYPRVRQFYEYLIGRHPGSLTLSHSRTPLICTWDYFYNSGGWDDYPPQLALHRSGKLNAIPVVGSAHAIRSARILQSAARELGLATEEYDRDIQALSSALQQYAWDPESGYFSYVVINDEGNPSGFLRFSDGSNFNMGLDGLSPLVSGICTEEQRKILWAKLESPEHCWTDCGISTVDRSASYYRNDGYWNGSVWFPHQWFFWKAALNDGRGDFAWKIAETALKLWERETHESYACYEQFSISSCRGSGWHHFSGLSTPVLCWFGAYYRPGRLTGGYDVWQKSSVWEDGVLTADLVISGEEGESTTLIAVMNAESAEYAGRSYPIRRRESGAVEVDLPKHSSGRLVLK